MELNSIIALTSKQNNSAIKLLDRLNFIKTKDLQNASVKFELNKT